MQERGRVNPPEDVLSCTRSFMERRPKPPTDQALKCPRCDSHNTKFCYYNNYSLSQPRHFCKSCRRYWTKGGALRNVPVGGGCRKNKRVKQKISPCTADQLQPNQPLACPALSPSLSPSSAFYNLTVAGSNINQLATLARAQQAPELIPDHRHPYAGCYGLSDITHLSSLPHAAFSSISNQLSGFIGLDFTGKLKPDHGTNHPDTPDLSAFMNPASHQLINLPGVTSPDLSKENVAGFNLGLDNMSSELAARWRMQQQKLKEAELHMQDGNPRHVVLKSEEPNRQENAETLRHCASSHSNFQVEEASKDLEGWQAAQGGFFEGANAEQNYWLNGTSWASDFSVYGTSTTRLL